MHSNYYRDRVAQMSINVFIPYTEVVTLLQVIDTCLDVEFTAEHNLRTSILNHVQMIQYLRPNADFFSEPYSAYFVYILNHSRAKQRQRK